MSSATGNSEGLVAYTLRIFMGYTLSCAFFVATGTMAAASYIYPAEALVGYRAVAVSGVGLLCAEGRRLATRCAAYLLKPVADPAVA